MDTTKGNKLIAELMGIILSTDGEDAHMNGYHYIGADGDKNLHYHSSWDWIMPVVEHIQSNHALEFAIEFGTESNFEGIVEKFYRAGFYRENKPFCRHPEWQKSQILAVWFTVVRFIEWYNDQKK